MKYLSLQEFHACLVLIMYGSNSVNPPSSYNHQTSITASFLFRLNCDNCCNISFGSSAPPGPLYNVAGSSLLVLGVFFVETSACELFFKPSGSGRPDTPRLGRGVAGAVDKSLILLANIIFLY